MNKLWIFLVVLIVSQVIYGWLSHWTWGTIGIKIVNTPTQVQWSFGAKGWLVTDIEPARAEGRFKITDTFVCRNGQRMVLNGHFGLTKTEVAEHLGSWPTLKGTSILFGYEKGIWAADLWDASLCK